MIGAAIELLLIEFGDRPGRPTVPFIGIMGQCYQCPGRHRTDRMLIGAVIVIAQSAPS